MSIQLLPAPSERMAAFSEPDSDAMPKDYYRLVLLHMEIRDAAQGAAGQIKERLERWSDELQMALQDSRGT